MVFSRRMAALSAVVLIPLGIAATSYALADSPRAPEVPAQQVELTAGEVLEADRAAPMLVAAADVHRAVTWKSGIVEFAGEPLSEAVAEMNRYTENPIRIADPAIANLRVSGVFRTGEPELFAHMVSEVIPVTAERGPNGTTVLRGRSG